MPERKLLKELRKNNNKSQANIAEACKISLRFYQMIEQGVRNPGLKTAKLISEQFGVPIEKIFFN